MSVSVSGAQMGTSLYAFRSAQSSHFYNIPDHKKLCLLQRHLQSFDVNNVATMMRFKFAVGLLHFFLYRFQNERENQRK